MATATPEISTGTTIAFESFFAEILSFEHSGMERGSVDVSHMGTTGQREFIPTDLYDAGELTVEMHFDATQLPPMDVSNTPSSCLITFPGGSGSTWTGTAFMTNFAYSAPLEDKMTATATLKYDGQTDVVVG